MRGSSLLVPFFILALVAISIVASASLPPAQLEQVKRVRNIDTGEFFDSIAEAIYDDDTLDNHTIVASVGVYVEHVTINKSIALIGEDPEGTILDGNSTGAILSLNAANVTVQNFTITNTDEYGIHVFRSNSSRIENNIVSNCAMGIVLLQSHFVEISSNLIGEATTGILLDYSSKNHIVKNQVSECHTAVKIETLCKNNRVDGNTEGNCTYGMALSNWSSDNVFTANDLAQNTQSALLFDRATNCTFVGNTFAHNNNVAEIRFLSDNNTFLHNNFLSNAAVMSSLWESHNFWNQSYPLGGNYWSDYSGTDMLGGPEQNQAGSDGVGDAPHNIDAYNTDGYPLFGVFFDFAASPQDHVSIVSNSTISDFRFNDPSLEFSAHGEGDTNGFCRICIPSTLIDAPLRVLVNETEIPHTTLPYPDITCKLIYFAYPHSTQKVEVILKAEGTAVYIKTDGTVDPPSAPISVAGDSAYTFTGNLNDSLIVERTNVLIDGKGYTLRGGGLVDSTGIRMDNVVNVTVTDIEVVAFDVGIGLSNSSNNTLLMCKLSSNSLALKVDMNSTGNKINSCEIQDCTNGVELGEQCDFNLFSNNRVLRCTQSGIRLMQSSNCTFIGNVFSHNNYSVEIVTALSQNNTFSHNTFLFTTTHVYSREQASNFWDGGYPVGGNFWDDYNGTDQQGGPVQIESGNDGIGDTLYIVDTHSQNVDNYPLMGIFIRAFNVSIEDGTTEFVGYSANSTITSFSFDSQTKALALNTTVEEQTFGFCKAVISKRFLNFSWQDLTVKVNGQLVSFKLREGPAHVSLCFTYSHSPAKETASIPVIYLIGVLMILVAFFFMIMRLKRISGMKDDEEEDRKNGQGKQQALSHQHLLGHKQFRTAI